MDERVYAVWLRVPDEGVYTYPNRFRCSNCRNVIKDDEIDDFIKRCPFCNARMEN